VQVAVSGAPHLVARAKSSGATHVVAADVSKVGDLNLLFFFITLKPRVE